MPHVFQNGTGVFFIHFASFVNVGQELCDGRTLCAEKQGNLVLAEPYGLVDFNPHKPAEPGEAFSL